MSEEKPIKPASTIILLREVPSENFEMFMVVRNKKIDVAGGALVFPGGKIDEDDYLAPIDNEISKEENAFRVGAIREAFEEIGILIARDNNTGKLINAERLESLSHYRDKLVNDHCSISDILDKEALSLATDLLIPFAHWVTPSVAPKRFDTHFYIALTPSNQIPEHDGSESVDSVWISPERALNEANEGKWKIIFPTKMNIRKLSQHNSTEALLDKTRNTPVVRVEPKIVNEDGETYLRIPEEAGYPISEVLASDAL